MQYDMHGEYPVILRQTDKGIVGTWYENRFKFQFDILRELEALGKQAEVAKIREYTSTHGGLSMPFEQKMEVQRRIQHLASTVKDYSPFQVVELVGDAYLEALAHPRWAVSGQTFVEWHEEAPGEDQEHLYQMELDGVFLKRLSQWNHLEERWVALSLLQLSYNTEMHQQVKGVELVATPCK